MIRQTFSIALTLLFVFSIPVQAQIDNSNERKGRIVDNLKHMFPQLEDRNVNVQDLSEVGDGMQQGAFVIDGQQQQAFLTNEDDTQFYLIAAGPFDVSKTQAELAEARKEREEEERQKAVELHAKLKPAVADMPGKGPKDAPITIIEFSDFQCPYCANAAQTINEVLAKNEGDIRLVYVHFPLESIHPWARAASIASSCASNQSVDAFWALHDAYFTDQKDIDSGNIIERSEGYLSSSDIDIDTWKTCSSDPESAEYQAASSLVDTSLQLGIENGVNSTPGFFINGRFISGAQPADLFQELIDQARAEL